jgi:hypothetical protein
VLPGGALSSCGHRVEDHAHPQRACNMTLIYFDNKRLINLAIFISLSLPKIRG